MFLLRSHESNPAVCPRQRTSLWRTKASGWCLMFPTKWAVSRADKLFEIKIRKLLLIRAWAVLTTLLTFGRPGWLPPHKALLQGDGEPVVFRAFLHGKEERWGASWKNTVVVRSDVTIAFDPGQSSELHKQLKWNGSNCFALWAIHSQREVCHKNPKAGPSHREASECSRRPGTCVHHQESWGTQSHVRAVETGGKAILARAPWDEQCGVDTDTRGLQEP